MLDFTDLDAIDAEIALLTPAASEERAVLREIRDAEISTLTSRGTDPHAFLGEEE